MAEAYPQVAATWLQERNGGLTPQKATPKMQVDVWWRCPAGHEWEERIANHTSLPKWKNGNVAACRECVGYRVSYTYPDCGHTVKVTPESAAKKRRRCWDCQNRWWQENEPRLKAELSAAAKAAADRAGKLLDAVALPADMPAPLATEWRWWAAKHLQGAIAAEEKMGKEGRTDEVLASVTEMAARLTPTKEKAGRAAATDGMLRLLNHTGDSSAAALQDWAHGWAKLKAFTEREGHARVPYEHKEGAFPLGNWVAEQRRVFGAGQMTGLHPPAGEARHGLERVGGTLGVFLSNSKSRRAKLTVDKLAALAAPRTGMGDGVDAPERARPFPRVWPPYCTPPWKYQRP